MTARPLTPADPPADALIAEWLQLGDERFNVPAILRVLQRELDSAYGGSERTQIALIMRFVASASDRIAQQTERIERLEKALQEIAENNGAMEVVREIARAALAREGKS